MKHLIEAKKTSTFVIEVRTNEPSHSHPIFPFLAESKEVLNPKTIFNKSYPNNVYTNSVAQWIYLRQNWMNEPYPYKYGLKDDFGFTTNTFEADTNVLNNKKQKRSSKKNKGGTKMIEVALSKAWLKEIGELAQKNGCTIHFLYLPPYGSPEQMPLESETYKKYGDVWILPDSLLNNKKNWYDTDHMNLQGANMVSRIVAEKLLSVQ